MNSKQSFFRSTYTFILLATFLGPTPICHAAINKPRINPKALTEWQRDVGRIAWETLKSKSLTQVEIGQIIESNKPILKDLITNLTTATQQAHQKPSFFDAPFKNLGWEKQQDIHVQHALEAFTEAQQKDYNQKTIEPYLEKFEASFSQLDDKNIIDLANSLSNLINHELNLIGDGRHKVTIKHGAFFLKKFNSLFIQKFKTQLDVANDLIAKAQEAERLKISLDKKIQDTEQRIQELNKKIESIQNLIHGRLKILLSGWKEGNPNKLIDISTDPEFMKRLDASQTDEIYRKKWYEIKDDPELIKLFEQRFQAIIQVKDLEKELDQLQQKLEQQDTAWLKASYDLQEFRTQLDKNLVYSALKTLIKSLEKLIRKQQEIKQAQTPQSTKTETVATRQGSSMAIPSRTKTPSKQQEQKWQEEPESEEQESWRTKDFTWQADSVEINRVLQQQK